MKLEELQKILPPKEYSEYLIVVGIGNSYQRKDSSLSADVMRYLYARKGYEFPKLLRPQAIGALEGLVESEKNKAYSGNNRATDMLELNKNRRIALYERVLKKCKELWTLN